MEPPLCVVSSWIIKRVYIILIWNTICGSSNLDNCFYHCLILTLIFLSLSYLKDLFNSLLNYIYILFIIYIVHLPVVRPRSCRVIYYFDTPTLGIRHQLFDRVSNPDTNSIIISSHFLTGIRRDCKGFTGFWYFTFTSWRIPH